MLMRDGDVGPFDVPVKGIGALPAGPDLRERRDRQGLFFAGPLLKHFKEIGVQEIGHLGLQRRILGRHHLDRGDAATDGDPKHPSILGFPQLSHDRPSFDGDRKDRIGALVEKAGAAVRHPRGVADGVAFDDLPSEEFRRHANTVGNAGGDLGLRVDLKYAHGYRGEVD